MYIIGLRRDNSRRDRSSTKEFGLHSMEVHEVFMVENGELVGHTATVDPKNGAVCEIAYCKLPTEDG